MTQELLESIQLYVSGTAKEFRKKALFCRENGHFEVARQHENSAALGDKILEDLRSA